MIPVGFAEIAKKVVEKTSKELPNFAKKIKPEAIRTFSEADKALNLPINETDGIKKIKTINENLEGKTSEKHNVPFEKKIVKNENNEPVEVVVPKFESTHDVKLPKDLESASDRKQFKHCNSDLKEKISFDPSLKDKFTPVQLEQIENNLTPDGYTWHHDAEKGKMQLVNSDIHSEVRHTGGRNIWGGGTNNR